MHVHLISIEELGGQDGAIIIKGIAVSIGTLDFLPRFLQPLASKEFISCLFCFLILLKLLLPSHDGHFFRFSCRYLKFSVSLQQHDFRVHFRLELGRAYIALQHRIDPGDVALVLGVVGFGTAY